MIRKNKISPENEEAYWISPVGEIFSVHESHISEIFDHPFIFSLSRSYLELIYDIHDEEYRTEGKAREEILLKLFEQGWIRARRYHRPYRWTLNVFSMTEQTVKNLKSFAEVMISNGKSLNDEVLIDTPEYRKIYTLNELRDTFK